jgi:hypothetical protein
MATSTKTRAPSSTNGKPAEQNHSSSNGDGNRPVHEERIGRICGAVWEHQDAEQKVWFNVTFNRIYKDGNGKWQRSESFGKGDIPLLIKVADRCHDWLYSNKNEEES